MPKFEAQSACFPSGDAEVIPPSAAFQVFLVWPLLHPSIVSTL